LGHRRFACTIMARLKTMRPKAGQERQRNERRSEHDASPPWRRWYKTSRWQKLRWTILLRDLFMCQKCERIEANTSLLVADHKLPHRGSEGLFWDADNLQCLCKTCHDTIKQAEERVSLHQRGVWY
jgi:5-methylcytosine-specific restriction endonuclease McrA